MQHKDVEKPLHAQKNVAVKRDCLTISSEAMEIQKTAQIYGQSENIKFDQNVDIASYFEAAREANQKTRECRRRDYAFWAEMSLCVIR
ncbi:MAG: hypothetical protein ACLTJ5_04230 [Clostridium sp.]